MQRQKQTLTVADFSLDHTLDSGQAFRWKRDAEGTWNGVVGQQLIRARQRGDEIVIEADDLNAVASYFQWHHNLREVVGAFPKDEHLEAAVKACWGLRILKQDPWECLASFIASSTKQIVQIKQIVENLSRNLGSRIAHCESQGFPSVETVSASTHEVLWNCKLGFRAKYLLGSARMIAEGRVDVGKIDAMNCDEAREYLCQLPGVGAKIANCVLLFAHGKREAFPIDVWVERCLREMYFARKRNVTPRRLREFARDYFGRNAGYAQQYLFHYIRTQRKPQPENS